MTNSRGRNREAKGREHSKMIMSIEGRRSTRKVYSLKGYFRSIHQDNQDYACERDHGISKNFPGSSPLKSRVGSQRVMAELGLLIFMRMVGLTILSLALGAIDSITTHEDGGRELDPEGVLNSWR